MTAVTVMNVQTTQVDYLDLRAAGRRPLGDLRDQNLRVSAPARTSNNSKNISHADRVSAKQQSVKEIAAYRAR